MITSPGECLQGSVSYGFRYVNTQATYDSSTGEGGLEDGIWVRDRKSPVIPPPPLTVQPRSEAAPSLSARALGAAPDRHDLFAGPRLHLKGGGGRTPLTQFTRGGGGSQQHALQ